MSGCSGKSAWEASSITAVVTLSGNWLCNSQLFDLTRAALPKIAKSVPNCASWVNLSSVFRHLSSGQERLMFERLSEKLSGIVDKLTGRGALSEENVNAAMREARGTSARGFTINPAPSRPLFAGRLRHTRINEA